MAFASNRLLKGIIPPLTRLLYKGNCGKVGIIGGCEEYTGAPYFAGMSCYRVGADLVHIFCSKAASGPIKSYSPELIVHPVCQDNADSIEIEDKYVESATAEIFKWLDKLRVLVVGCGMGRSPIIAKTALNAIKKARQLSIPVIIDGDGIDLVIQERSVFEGNHKCILSPNFMEFMRLCKAFKPEVLPISTHPQDADRVQSAVSSLANELENLTILSKGPMDIISDGRSTLLVTTGSSPRRCGGQGDVLAGCVAVFTMWSFASSKDNSTDSNDLHLPKTVMGAYGGAFLTRECSSRAFLLKRRGMVCTDVMDQIGTAFDELFSGVEEEEESDVDTPSSRSPRA